MANSITAGDRAQSNESLFGRIARGIGRALRRVGTFVFEALREAYWGLNRDSKIRAQGLQAVGQVVKTDKKEHEGSEGGVYYTHHVTYEYEVGGRTRTVEKKVHRFDKVKSGDQITVYYLSDTHPIESAIDRDPRPLPEQPVRSRSCEAANSTGCHLS